MKAWGLFAHKKKLRPLSSDSLQKIDFLHTRKEVVLTGRGHPGPAGQLIKDDWLVTSQ